MSDSIADWQPGQQIDLRGRKKVLRAGGILSKSGDVARQLGSLSRYLRAECGFVRGDFLEMSYRTAVRGGEWAPVLYESIHAEAPIAESTEHVVRQLRWYDARLPGDVELHLVGYSLGGVVLFGAAVELLTEDPRRWRARLRSLSTLASPHFGSDLGPEGELLGAFGFDALFPGGAVGRELRLLGRDPTHRVQVVREADFLERMGVRLLTLADEFDAVVTPDDAVIAAPDERARYVLSSSRVHLGGVYSDAVLGHGPLLENPQAWRLVAELIGPQQPRAQTSASAIPL